ncbi:MAG: S8 family serine peptidase [Myxococcota bacterium]
MFWTANQTFVNDRILAEASSSTVVDATLWVYGSVTVFALASLALAYLLLRRPATVRRQRRAARAALLAMLAMTFVAAGCGDVRPTTPTLQVDPSVTPSAVALPPIVDSEPRPLAAVEDEDGNRAQFVSNELWVSSDDETSVAALVDRWNGEVLLTFDPEVEGFEGSGLSKQHLVRIETSLADTTGVELDLQAMDENASGTLRISGEEVRELLAASAQEALEGLDVGLNWVGEGAGDYRDEQIFDAPSGSRYFDTPYSTNPLWWPSHMTGNAQDIGVVEAWRLLAVAGKLDNRIKIAILDMGFDPDDDFADGWSAASNVPFVDAIGTENLLFCGGGSDCPWHGHNVASAATALPDNGYGAAGPAGPIADPHLVFTSYDFFTAIGAIANARLSGARIANMSFGAPVPTALAWTVGPFDAATAAARASGMLIFAAAGNDGKNVDATKRVLFANVETTWHTPCENSGVICVGGLYEDTVTLDASSNYGGEHVDLYAPYTVYVGPDPENPANVARVINGTSFSSPFAAGVAALIWAADPGLSAGEVEGLLLEHTKASYDDRVKRVVSAHRAVRAALGSSAPNIRFNYPIEDGYQVQVGAPALLGALVEDVEDGRPCCDLSWRSNVDGSLGQGSSIRPVFTTTGSRTVVVTATDSDGMSATASVVIEVVNTPPTVQIARPLDGETTLRGQPFRLQGQAFDPNEADGAVACNALTWESDIATDSFPLIGCEVEVTFHTSGPRTLTLTAVDSAGIARTEAVEIVVLDPPVNLPPVVRVDPVPFVPGTSFYPWRDPIRLSGTATDPEGDTQLTYTWTITESNIGTVTIGTGRSISWTPKDDIPGTCDEGHRTTVRLTVSDSGGSTGSDFIVLDWYFTC